jgi:hypothetical protein
MLTTVLNLLLSCQLGRASGERGTILESFVPWKQVKYQDMFFIVSETRLLSDKDSWSEQTGSESNPFIQYGKLRPSHTAWQRLIWIPNNPDSVSNANPVLAWLIVPGSNTTPKTTNWHDMHWTTTFHNPDGTTKQIALVLGHKSEMGITLPGPDTFSEHGHCFCSFRQNATGITTVCNIVQQGSA